MTAIIQQPKRRIPASRMKVHLHLVKVNRLTYRLVTLRPVSGVCFSTNYYHNTWHILSDKTGANMLARLMWGLAYQNKPGTMVLIHDRHLKPTPFEADRSDPILLLNSNLTSLDGKRLRKLKSLLPALRPAQTIRWHTFGLDAMRGDQEARDAMWDEAHWKLDWDWSRAKGEHMTRCGGFVCYSAPPEILCISAVTIDALKPWHDPYTNIGMDYYHLAGSDGEVQIFSNYRRQLAAAQQARKQVHPERGMLGFNNERVQMRVIQKRDQLLNARRKS